MTGREMETVAEGLFEAVDDDYLSYRTASVRRVHDRLKKTDVPVVSPPGGHAVFIDAKRGLPHIPPSAYPGQALAAGFYEFSGVRGCEIGSVMLGGYRNKKPFLSLSGAVSPGLPPPGLHSFADGLCGGAARRLF